MWRFSALRGGEDVFGGVSGGGSLFFFLGVKLDKVVAMQAIPGFPGFEGLGVLSIRGMGSEGGYSTVS